MVCKGRPLKYCWLFQLTNFYACILSLITAYTAYITYTPYTTYATYVTNITNYSDLVIACRLPEDYFFKVLEHKLIPIILTEISDNIFADFDAKLCSLVGTGIDQSYDHPGNYNKNI
ncbi:hypothetical protein BDF21DRAFT_394803 [Thamnidium elegans]|nr:hypothetical protein BDF21DRAFT_394803 [Thamnidium elegans]